MAETHNTYGLYRENFDRLCEVLAYYSLGLDDLGYDALIEQLEEDRPSFDEDKFGARFVKWQKRIARAHKIDLQEHLLNK